MIAHTRIAVRLCPATSLRVSSSITQLIYIMKYGITGLYPRFSRRRELQLRSSPVIAQPATYIRLYETRAYNAIAIMLRPDMRRPAADEHLCLDAIACSELYNFLQHRHNADDALADASFEARPALASTQGYRR